MKELICITCPKGCHLTVDEQTLSVTGNACPRGAEYARKELTNPTRVLTTTVRLEGGALARLPVKSSSDLPKPMLRQVVLALRDYTAHSPVRRGDVLIHDILGTGADIVATRSL